MRQIVLLLCSLTASAWSSSLQQHAHAHPRAGRQQGLADQHAHAHELANLGQPKRVTLNRDGRQIEVQGGVDFSAAELDPDTGLMCVLKEIQVDTLEKTPILECTHQNVEKCHYTYITQFKPTQEQICTENFKKKCQISFKQQAYNETVQKCYKPVQKVCNGEGDEICKTVFESSCTNKYVEKQPGKFVSDSQCEKLPIEVCGKGCTFEEGEEECHSKVVTSLVDLPEEVCDLNPEKICRFTTKLVPRLVPQHECTIVPKEACHLKFSNPVPAKKPLMTKWCLDPTAPAPGESYDESNAIGDPLGPSSPTGNPAAPIPAATPRAPVKSPSDAVDPVPSQTPAPTRPTGDIDLATGLQEDFSVLSPDRYEGSTFSPDLSFPADVQPPLDEPEYIDITGTNNPYEPSYEDYNNFIEDLAPESDAPTSSYGNPGAVITKDTIEQVSQFSPAPAPVDPIQAPVDPIIAPVDPIPAPVDPILLPLEPANPRNPGLLEPAIAPDNFYGAPVGIDESLAQPTQEIKDEMVPPEVKAPMSFYGAPEGAEGAETEAVLEEILPVPAEEPQTFYGAPRSGRVLALTRTADQQQVRPARLQQQQQNRRPQQSSQQRRSRPRPHRGPARHFNRG